MAGGVRRDPFERWRAQQLAPSNDVQKQEDGPEVTWLSPGRQGLVDAATADYLLLPSDTAWDRVQHIQAQQFAVQHAEDHGNLPTTIEGALAVLAVAAEIIELAAQAGITL